jgi:hypothetical protein
MAGFIYNSGWKTLKSIFVYNGGWRSVKSGWVYNSGWKQFFSSRFTIENTVTISQSTGTDGLVTLTGRNYHWAPTPTSLTYKFEWSTDGGSNWFSIATGNATNPSSGSSNTYTYKVAKEYVAANTDNLYRFVVTATSSGITTFDNSNTTTIGGPYDTFITITNATTNQVSFSWEPSLYANRYITYYYNVDTGTNYYAQNGAGGTNGTSATITNLTKNTSYIFYVMPITGTAGSNLSNYYGYPGNPASAYQKTVYGYTITYNANGGSNPPVDNTNYDYGTLVTVKPKGSMTYGTKAFQSWNTSADGTGTSYNPQGVFYLYDSVTLYAQWLDAIYPPNPVGSLTFYSGTSYINWTFTPSAVDSTHSPATTYAYTTNTTGVYPSNGGGLEINADVWAPDYTFAIQLLSPGSTYYGFIQPANIYNGTKQYAEWTRTKAMTKPPVPTYTYYYGLQGVAGGGINIYGHSSSTSLSYTVYRTANGTANPSNSYVGYGTGTIAVETTGTLTKSEGATYFGTWYPTRQGYYYIVAYQTNLGGDGATSTSQIAPQNWFWGPPPAPTNTSAPTLSPSSISVGTQLTAGVGSWSGSPTSYDLRIYRGTQFVSTNETLVASTTSTSLNYTVTQSDYDSGARYFKVYASASNSAGSSGLTGGTEVGPIATPVTVFIPSGGSVTLSGSSTPGSVITATTDGWANSPTSYDVYITTTTSGTPTSSSSRVSSSGGSFTTSYTITSSDAAPPANIFRAFATASNSAGTSGTVQSSNIITATSSGGGGGGGGGGTAPAAPTISGNNSLGIGGTFSWSSSGATGYAFSIYGPSGLQYSTYGSYVSTTSFRPGYDAVWQGAGTYSVYVYAHNANGDSPVASLDVFMN